MKVQYSIDEVKELFSNYSATEIPFDLSKLKISTSALNITFFNTWALKLELIYFNKKFNHLYDNLDNITMQIYNTEVFFMDTVNVLPYQDLLAVLKQRTNDHDGLVILLLPTTRESYEDKDTDTFNFDKLQNFSFVAFDTRGSDT